MRPLLITALLLVPFAGASRADETVWLELRTADKIGPQAKPAQGPAGETAIEVTGGDAASATTLLVCEEPAVHWPQYVVRGRVKYAGVVGDGYLELWNDFGEHGAYFTRALAPTGQMGKMSGDSDWREFTLPFYAGDAVKLHSLTLNVVLPGAGTVTVCGPVTVGPLAHTRLVPPMTADSPPYNPPVAAPPTDAPMEMIPLSVAPINESNAWWTESQSGLIGGSFGAAVGTVGGLIGLSTAWRRMRRLTVVLYGVALSVCGASLVAGLLAIGTHQPWHVYYTLLLIGFLGVTVFGVNYRAVFHRFRDDELRRISAIDIG
jgi:hypothetical protein